MAILSAMGRSLVPVLLVLGLSSPAWAQMSSGSGATPSPRVIMQPDLATTSTDGQNIENPTAATLAIPVQLSPRGRFTGYGWDTDDTVSRSVRFFTEVLPVSGATVTGTFKLGWMDPTTNALTYPLTVSSAGVVTALNVFNGLGISVGSTGYYIFGNGPHFKSPTNGQLNLFSNSSENVGIGLDFATDALLKVRTWAQTGDASIQALDHGVSGQILARESFKQPHMVVSSAFAGKALTDTAVNLVLGSPAGIVEYREELEKTASSWVETTTGLDISADDTIDNEGVEIYLGDGADTTTGWHIARGSTGACFSVNFTVALIAGTDQFVVGWRKNEVWRDDNVYAGYADWSVVGLNNVDGSIFSLGEVNGGGTLSDDSGVNAANADTRTLKVCLAATTGVPTAYYTANGGTTFTAITMTNSGTAKTNGIQMNPFISYLQAGGAVDAGIKVNWWEITRP